MQWHILYMHQHQWRLHVWVQQHRLRAGPQQLHMCW